MHFDCIYYYNTRCLVLIEDFDRDQNGALGPSGMIIQHKRYEALVEQKWNRCSKEV